jgi:rhamnose utilization protein RhaD (predicted bifunctional aldolase and dehydrogenase)/NAD(P)-dependent dehydrogenase (short-subunit alcohol dehydrogenase family)
MESRYRTEDAQRCLDEHAPRWGKDLALRVYTSRLLGQEPALVLHGGGNTSVKTRVTELLGDETDVLYVKGSGWDLGTIEPRGFPACRLAPLRRCCEQPRMSDEEMVAQLRGQMIDPSSPTPSVEALLHAYLPAKFIDHTHADAVLSVVDQPDSAARVRQVFGEGAMFVPYVMPGFVLARKVAELWRARSAGSEPTAMILDKHGIFTWGETALESYQRMIDQVTAAERYLAEQRKPTSRLSRSSPSAEALAAVAPVARGALTRASGRSWVACFRSTPQLLAFCERDDLDTVTSRGCITPDHVIRTKSRPMVIAAPVAGDAAALRSQVEAALEKYAEGYRDYFRRASEARRVSPMPLDPWPRVLLLRGLGALTFGSSLRDAEIAADIYEHTAQVIDDASAVGRYQPVGELDLFDVEYWSLEQAKLGKAAAARPLDGKIAVVTGAASGIGLATAAALLSAGAHVVLADREAEALEARSLELSSKHRGRLAHARCDVTSPGDVHAVLSLACRTFGGLDVVVSNAGMATAGPLHGPEGDRALRASLEVNLLSHQTVAAAAAQVMLAQGTGGALLFNASKSAFNQGRDFGPYAVPKAALVSLMRQYAVDLGAHGIRANAVNADRIRTALFGGGMAEARAQARGVTVDEYFRDNLLRRETTAEDVAAAFVHLATAEATTGCVLTVDGGNAAAFPR